MDNINVTCLGFSEYDKKYKGIRFATKVEYYSKETRNVINPRHYKGKIFFFPQNIIVQMEYDVGEAPLRYEDIRAYVKVGENNIWKEIKISCSGCNSNYAASPDEAVEAFFKITGINPYENKIIAF